MGNNKLSFQAELSELYRTGKTIGRSGAVVNATGLSTISNLTTIRELIIDKNPQSTLEIGMAYGGSALVILSTLQSIFGDNAQFHHTAIDPYQGQFDHAGVEIVKRAKLDQNFKWVESSSELALPKMVAEGIKYDFIYIDGSHLFEHVFVDMFYSLMLLNKGGIMLFDDSMDSHVAKVISFIKNNLNTYLKTLSLKPFRENISLFKMMANAFGYAQVKGFVKVTDLPRPYNTPFVKF
jgi:predicted O-methyltransferase YrrM